MCLLEPCGSFFGMTLGLEQVVNTLTKVEVRQ